MGRREARAVRLPSRQPASLLFGMLWSPGFIVNLFLDDAVDALPTSTPQTCFLLPTLAKSLRVLFPFLRRCHSLGCRVLPWPPRDFSPVTLKSPGLYLQSLIYLRLWRVTSAGCEFVFFHSQGDLSPQPPLSHEWQEGTQAKSLAWTRSNFPPAGGGSRAREEGHAPRDGKSPPPAPWRPSPQASAPTRMRACAVRPLPFCAASGIQRPIYVSAHFIAVPSHQACLQSSRSF